MKTKSGRSHFRCELLVYDQAGNLSWQHTDRKFTAVSAKDYIDRTVKRFASKGYTAEFKNVVNLDEEEKG